MHQVTTKLATSENVLFPSHNHLLTTGTDDPTLWLLPERQWGWKSKCRVVDSGFSVQQQNGRLIAHHQKTIWDTMAQTIFRFPWKTSVTHQRLIWVHCVDCVAVMTYIRNQYVCGVSSLIAVIKNQWTHNSYSQWAKWAKLVSQNQLIVCGSSRSRGMWMVFDKKYWIGGEYYYFIWTKGIKLSLEE